MMSVMIIFTQFHEERSYSSMDVTSLLFIGTMGILTTQILQLATEEVNKDVQKKKKMSQYGVFGCWCSDLFRSEN